MANWIIKTNDADIALMAKTLKINPILCEILAGRGLRTKNTCIKYLNPLPGYMHDAGTMAGVARACEIVLGGIKQGKRFIVFGDYDVDGVGGTVILHKALTKLGAVCKYYIPLREQEGYGLNPALVEKIAKEADVLITLDNGIAALEEVALAKRLGMDVVIIDHHQPAYVEEDGGHKELLPPADAIIDPKQQGCGYPFKELCAAGLAYKFAEHLHKAAGVNFDAREEAMIFAAIATFCDVVDLVDENRIIAATGLDLLNRQKSSNIGLNSLVKARNLEYNKIDTFEVGFILGPCINATGRLASAGTAVELFLCDDQARADELAGKLVELNDERKALCARFVDKTIASLEGTKLDKVLVLYDQEIHESIAGIVAGRVKEALCRPTIVIAKSGEVAKGSARSIEQYDMFAQMQKCKDLFLRFGGHKMAAGVTLVPENIDAFRERLNSACTLTDQDFVPNLYVDKMLALEEVTYELAQALQAMAPFGKANRQPVFATQEVFTESAEIIGKSGETMRLGFRLASGRRIRAVAFKSVQKFAGRLAQAYSDEVCQGFLTGRIRNLTVKLDIAYHVEINTYNGNSSVQLNILDFKF